MALADDLTRGVEWPPPEHRARIGRQLEAGILYRNRPEELIAHYSRELQPVTRTASELQAYPAGKVICRTLASLLFGDEPTVSHDDTAVQQLLDGIAPASTLAAYGAEAALTQGYEGEVYLRPAWDTELDPRHPLLDAVPGSRAIPVFRFGQLVEVAFVTTRRTGKAGDYHRHVEYHERGRIVHRLYHGTDSNLGTAVQLRASGLTRHLLDSPEDDRDEVVIETEVDRLLPVHVPLGRDSESPHGVSMFDGTENLLLGLHRLYTQEQHDAELAKRRIAVTESLLRSAGGRRSFDRDADLLVLGDEAVGAVGAESGPPVIPVEFHDDNVQRERIRGRLSDLLIAVGISPYTVVAEEGAGGAVSGTSRRLAQALTLSTAAMTARYWQASMRDLLVGAVLIQSAQLTPQREVEGDDGPVPYAELVNRLRDTPPTVKLSDGMIDDETELAKIVAELRGADALSVEQAVAKVHPEWSEDERRAEVDAIRAELGNVPEAQPSAMGDLDLDGDDDGLDGLV